ncbi:MAG: hypothetical protein HYY18_04900 [Planctomycetes bacterium]|nr:hypothetical protein [Planctomycetota bacterium]
MPAWREIDDLVLARGLEPAEPEFEALCLQAEKARRLGAGIASVVDDLRPDFRLVEHLDLPGFPELALLAFIARGSALETWHALGGGCWGRLQF